MREVSFPSKARARDRRICEAEIARILETLGHCELLVDPYTARDRRATCSIRLEIAIAFLLAIETAMRQGEIWGLTWDDVHLTARYC